MDRAYVPAALIEGRRVCVRVEEHWHVADLRYFDPAGKFAAQAAAILGHAIPAILSISAGGSLKEPRSLLAWRSPTESFLLCSDAEHMQRLAAPSADGCCVEQTGGHGIVRIEGTAGADVMARLGGVALNPPVGAAHGGRLADVPAFSLRLTEDVLLVAVDRFYLEHLLRSIELTVRDLG